MPYGDPLALFLPPVRDWFRRCLGEPTPVQRLGWPAIAAGKNTLLLAPTGSGKTLAAFLACLDGLWRQDPLPPGTRILYISPLKALNNDIFRNLQVPLDGVAQLAGEMDFPLPKIECAVRTGDTTTAERQKLLRRPPHVLITTPESLHLLLTSRARDTLRGITHCIVDEIHALCPNKRGVFLALLLERLQTLNPPGFLRIGLSATQRPLDEVARYLGGSRLDETGAYFPRPVTIVDAGLRKDLDLRVVSPVDQFGPLPEKSIWPSIYRLLAGEIARHRSTIIFVNNRRSVERITAQLQEFFEYGDLPVQEKNVVFPQQSPDVTQEKKPPPLTKGGPGGVLAVKAHHGSVSLEVRQETERALKEGRLRAVVATASLELGIDMGAVDLVCQVESTGNVARALQRVGRAGHLVGRQSKGRLIPKTLADLLDQAVLAAEMAAGRVEEMRVPVNCLDVLAQQIIAMVAMDTWDVSDLYRQIRQAYPFREITPKAFDAVLEMVTGRYRFQLYDVASGSETLLPSPPATMNENLAREETAGGEGPGVKGEVKQDISPLTPDPSPPPASSRQVASSRRAGERGAPGFLISTSHNPANSLTALQPRISWDRVHHRLEALPGSQRLALTSGGTIPDTGQFAVTTPQGLRLGEVDEEFVWERRVGDTFLLGTNAWRIEQIDTDRLLVSPAAGAPAMVPFWRGESTGRSFDLGQAQGRFLRKLEESLDDPGCLDWLQRDHYLDPGAARNLRDYVRRQKLRAGFVPSERVLGIEAARDPLGDWQVVLLSPLGSRIHLTLRLALESVLRRRLGYGPQCLHHDDGVLIRLTDSDEPVVDLFEGLTPENLQGLVLDELADSALFALRFRQNAARAMLMPRGQANRRAPLWLQRLRGRDLLQAARRFPDFPIVAETFRECLHDHLDVPRVQQLLADIRDGQVEVHTCRLEAPSPFAAGLLFAFQAAAMYQYDDVEAEPGKGYSRLDQELLDHLVPSARLELDPRAVRQVERRLRGVGQPPRTKAEMAEWLRRLGDVAPTDLEGPMAGFLRELEDEGRVKRLHLPRVTEPDRWILTEEEGLYLTIFGASAASAPEKQQAAATILYRFLETHALVGLRDVLGRYPFEEDWARRTLEDWARGGRLVRLEKPGAPEPLCWSAAANFEQLQRGTLAVLRREVTTCPATQFVDFVLHWQKAHPAARGHGPEGLAETLDRLQGIYLPADLWEQAVLPARIEDYQGRWLDEMLAAGQWLWVGQGGQERGPGQVALLARENVGTLPALVFEETPIDHATEIVYETMQTRGALFVPDLAQATGLTPNNVRAALWSLARRGLATNDHFEVVRRGEDKNTEPPAETQHRMRRGGRVLLRPGTGRRARVGLRPEGRWSLVPWGQPDPENAALSGARRLLQRYGIVAREMALLDAHMPPWRVLYEVLNRLELAGEVRRGYFVEGLSGAQFALPEAARVLRELTLPASGQTAPLLLPSLDPANLYGSGAPFDIPLLEEGTRPFQRRPGNWLVLQACRPILLVEQQGKRLTALPSARPEDLAAAAKLLPGMVGKNQVKDIRHKLRVETWNEKTVTATEGKDFLEAAGFVRDYQAMTWYALWN